MDWHRPTKARFEVREESGDIEVSCQYWSVRHDAKAGGGIAGIVFPYGSGKNILTAPCQTRIGVYRDHRFLTYTPRDPDSASCLSYYSTGDTVCVETENPLMTNEGARLPAVCRHRYEYHPWGYIRQRVTIDCAKPVPNVWQVLIGNMAVAPHLDTFALRPAPAQDADWHLHCFIPRWYDLQGGNVASDYMAVRTAVMPIQFTMLQPGVEGFDWFMADNLDQWHRQLLDGPNVNHFLVRYASELNGYEVRIGALEYYPTGVTLKGVNQFDFFMGLPFVQERVRPLVRAIGGLLESRPDKRGTRFPAKKTIANYARHGVQLTRLHNDHPALNGIFWRDGAYPPYPPKRMKEMDRAIGELHRKGIRVAPYFSLREFHPEVPAFARKGREWQRVVDETGQMLHNNVAEGEYGAQMCMASGWLDFRKKTIDQPLTHHEFDGIYYDWTAPIPCLHRGHRPYAHWDVEEFIHLLEWTRERVGPEGVIYLHMSAVPFAVAENLATQVLTYEETSPAKLTPDMFPPATPYLKTCAHSVCVMGEGRKSPRLYALCCLLNHVTPDGRHPDILRTFRAVAGIDFTKYTHFRDHHNSAVHTSSPAAVRSAIYWNDHEALALLANLSDKAQRLTWNIAPKALDWTPDRTSIAVNTPMFLEPLGLRYVRVRRVVRR